MAENKGSYAGRIQNSGAQKVSAPFVGGKKGRGTVKSGSDLRTEKKSGK